MVFLSEPFTNFVQLELTISTTMVECIFGCIRFRSPVWIYSAPPPPPPVKIYAYWGGGGGLNRSPVLLYSKLLCKK